MKKLSYILMLFLFAFIACQTDNVNTAVETLESETIELKVTENSNLDIQTLNVIPKEFAGDPLTYVKEQFNTTAKGDDTYGCVTFENGIAYIDPDCDGITSGIPERYKDCDRKGVHYLDCGVWDENPFCIICAVLFTVECDGRLGDVLGYNIVCFYPAGPQPFEP
jgi:hypothetical protein